MEVGRSNGDSLNPVIDDGGLDRNGNSGGGGIHDVL